MAKYFYNEADYTFLCDPIEYNGEIVTGACVYVRFIPVDKYLTDSPFSCGDDEEPWDAGLARHFTASVHPETGIILTPDIESLTEYKRITGNDIAVSIVEYNLDIGSWFKESKQVSREDFKTFIKDHFEAFDRSDNDFAQTVSYCAPEVDKPYERNRWFVHIDANNLPFIAKRHERGKYIGGFISSAKSREEAMRISEEYLKNYTHQGKTYDDWFEDIRKRQEERAISLLKEKYPEDFADIKRED